MDNTSRTPIMDASANGTNGSYGRAGSGGVERASSGKSSGGGGLDKDGVYLWEGYPRVASAPSQVFGGFIRYF